MGKKIKYGPGIVFGVMPMPDPNKGWGGGTKGDPGCLHTGLIILSIPAVSLLAGAYWFFA